jgi:hypothetical protein
MMVDAEGTFSTGTASTDDAGYFLLTGPTFTALRDVGVTGILNTGGLTTTSFEAGSAYDPTTQAFINHNGGVTFANIGNVVVSGSTRPINLDPSFVLGASFVQGDNVNILTVIYD